jgi:regulatory protein
MKITSLEPQERHPDRYNMHLDGKFALALDAGIVLSEGLHVGDELSRADLERIQSSEEERRLFDAALHFLAPRPRSRVEVRRRLLTPRPNRPAPSAEMVERVLTRLEASEILNDHAFADFWVQNRERFSPRSARALGQELRQRGVDRETVDAVSAPDRDEERALAAGRQKLRMFAAIDYEEFRTKLGQFLLRRGFGYGTARAVVRQLWDETHGEGAGDAGDEDDGFGDQ